jgi:dTDP-4-amino-4,6-dideoxygalactose transaminase
MTLMSRAPLSGRPAADGGDPAFPDGFPLARPSLPDPEAVVDDVRRILTSEVLTNGPYVRRLEEQAAAYLGVRHCIAVSSCTAGLMLVLRASDLTGDVVVPSFTFAATAHAVVWNGLRPVFADIDPHTLTLSPASAAAATGVRTSAILATHTFGTPCDVESLGEIARSSGISVFFDAAHAFGSRHRGSSMGGFGDAEVFSLTPTKPLVAGEGGIIATNDADLADQCRSGRDYGKEPDYDFRFVGLNARMSEFHAAMALASLANIEERIAQRNVLAASYLEALADIDGVSFPVVPESDRSTFKDFTILVEADTYGMDAATLATSLAAEGIETRRYYSPPVHATRAYRSIGRTTGELPVTESVSSRVVTLPLWGDMTPEHVERIAGALRRIHGYAVRGAAGVSV